MEDEGGVHDGGAPQELQRDVVEEGVNRQFVRVCF